jgi:hypothetical protein
MINSTSSINNYPNIFSIQSGQSLEQLANTLTNTAKLAMPADSVTISSSATALQQFLNSEMQGGETSSEMGEMDLMGLAQLKQRGEMLASMLQLKMKNFESHLISSVQGAGLSMQNMDIKNGDDGLLLMGEMQNKEAFQNVIGGLQGEFMDISRLANVLNMLQQLGPDNMVSALSSVAAQYAQQSLPEKTSVKRQEGDFVMHVMPSGSSFSFE